MKLQVLLHIRYRKLIFHIWIKCSTMLSTIFQNASPSLLFMFQVKVNLDIPFIIESMAMK